MILAGDIGGTKTVIALFDNTAGGLKLVRDATFPSKDHASLEEILEQASCKARKASRCKPAASASPAR